MVNPSKIIEKAMPSLVDTLHSFDQQLEEQLQVQKEILAEMKKLNERRAEQDT